MRLRTTAADERMQAMDTARITSGGQATIPKPIRDAAGLAEGDVIAFEIEGDHVVVRKVDSGADGYLHGLARHAHKRVGLAGRRSRMACPLSRSTS